VNFLQFVAKPPKDPLNVLSLISPSQDTPWWEAYTYAYGVSADGKIYDLLTSLENENDPDACLYRIWYSQAVWPDDYTTGGCWSGGPIERADQIYSVK
jgi:hypothetical protein